MGRIILDEQTTPNTPAADKVAFYPKAGGGIYKKNDAGEEKRLVEAGADALIASMTGLSDDGIPAEAVADGIEGAILVDGTKGRILRFSALEITDGTNAETLKVSMYNRFNGDVIASTDNIAKGATTGDFSLSVSGQNLTIKATGLSGNAVAGACFASKNATGTNLTYRLLADANDLGFLAKHATTGINQDLTVLVDTGMLQFEFIYITDA